MRWLTQLVSWVATILIARLLTPADYGIVGMAVVYSGLIEMISDFGLGAAIVQRRDLGPARIAQLGGVALGLGVFLFTASVLLATPIAWFYGEPAVTPIIMVLAVNFVLAGIQLVPQSLLVRDLRFRQLAWVHAAEALSLTACSLTLAVLGAGYWALVVGLVTSKVTGMVFALGFRRHAIAWPFPLRHIASEITFGWQFMVSNIAWYLYNNADFAIVGRVLGKVVLGAYTIAWSLASVPVERVSALLGNVFRGIFSAVQHDRVALARYLCILTEGLAIVTFPAAVGLSLVADDCVRLLLGEKWLAAVEPLRLLALYAAVRSVSTLFAPLLVATGHNRLSMQFNLLAAAVMPVLFLLGTRWGMVGVAVAWIVGYTMIVISLFLRQVLRILQLPLGRYLRSLAPAALATGVMGPVVLLVQRSTSLEPGSVARMLVTAGSGAVVYAAVLWLAHGRRLRGMMELVREAIRAPGQPPLNSSS
jgi:PST family polysaccharide transporter